MNNDNDELRRAIALFRYGVISDLLHPPEPRERGWMQRTLEEKAARDYEIPGSRRRRAAEETIRGWLKDYRRGGFDALAPKRRSDAGASRSLPREIQDLLLTMKEAHPEYSIPVLIDEVRLAANLTAEVALPHSTVHRLLARHGLMKRSTPAADKDHRRFEFEKAGQLWMSDVMHGPTVTVEGKRRRKTYLIAFIDDATRVVPFACFALAENTAAFLPVLKQAVLRRGVPERLFVDNGSAFRSQQLAIVVAKLGITLVHARAYHPQAKGKIERFFRTVRGRFLIRVREEDLCSLEALNRRLWAWVESEYHQTPHGSLDETPLDRWARTAEDVRAAPMEVDELFLFEAKRKVRKDRLVSLDGQLYEVDANLVDQTVTLRFEPLREARRGVEVWVDGRRVQIAKPVDTHANCFVQRERPRGLSLAQLSKEEEDR